MLVDDGADSRNMEIQPATYDSIKQGAWLTGSSLSQPHGMGHAWAAFLWDMTWDSIEKHGFNPNLYATGARARTTSPTRSSTTGSSSRAARRRS